MIISVICPCRNEVGFIDDFLSNVCSQDVGIHEIEIIIADGQSDDGTREVLAKWKKLDKRLRLVENEARIVSTGLNIATLASSGEIIVRMDVHTEYAENYILESVQTLMSTGYSCVGGPWLAEGISLKGKAIAQALNSRFGAGGARLRMSDYTGPVDNLYLGCWYKEELIDIGLFDERLVRNQDDELCFRFIKRGGMLWQSSRIKSSYRPRSDFRKLAQQYFQYGFWKTFVIRKHHTPASIRHVVPSLFIMVLLITGVLGLVSPNVFLVFLFILFSYAIANVTCSIKNIRSLGIIGCCYCSLAFACMHFGYGTGFVLGFFRSHRSVVGKEGFISKLTR